MCQWVVNLQQRMTELGVEISLHKATEIIRVAIPDFHINGHGQKCQSPFSLIRMPKVGRFCAEGIETEWASTNPLAASAREMTTFHREELLNDNWGNWNWQKTVLFGT